MSCPSSYLPDVVKGLILSSNDFLVISEDELEAPQDLLCPDSGNYLVAVQLLNLSQYYSKEVYLKLHKIVDPAC